MMDRRTFSCTSAGALVLARSLAVAQPVREFYRIGSFPGASGESVVSLFGASLYRSRVRNPHTAKWVRAKRTI
jgi:hypothetical protein